jgi:hypothetical protein
LYLRAVKGIACLHPHDLSLSRFLSGMMRL